MEGEWGRGVNGKVGAQTGGVGELGYRVPFAGEGKQEEGSRVEDGEWVRGISVHKLDAREMCTHQFFCS